MHIFLYTYIYCCMYFVLDTVQSYTNVTVQSYTNILQFLEIYFNNLWKRKMEKKKIES